jgi:hypothetical protein
MTAKHSISLLEDKIVKNDEGKVIHHPLNGPYSFDDGGDYPGYGYLSFCGHDLDKSPILNDIHVFYLEFSGETIGHREAWADNLRANVLKKISGDHFSWYLGITEYDAALFSGILLKRQLDKKAAQNLQNPISLMTITVDSEIKYGYGKGFIKRVFFEIPGSLIDKVVLNYWPEATQGWPIEGYCMASGQLDLFADWNNRPRDDILCKDVLDQVRLAFYTFPAEHRHFVILTNKMLLEEMVNIIQLKSLQRRARKIVNNPGSS